MRQRDHRREQSQAQHGSIDPRPRRPKPVRPSSAPEAEPLARGPTNGAKPVGKQSTSRRVLVDASNVAHATEDTPPRLANLLLVRDRLAEEGLEPILVADAALRHQIDDGEGYEALVKSGELRQAPAGTDADYFILSFARELDASVLSNDRFKERIAHFPEVKNRIMRYMIVADELVLERRGRRRGG